MVIEKQARERFLTVRIGVALTIVYGGDDDK